MAGRTTPSDLGGMFGMTYDGAGDRLTMPVSVPALSGATAYQYDYGQRASPQARRSQLTGETSTRGSGSFSYAYDGNGNPTTYKTSALTFDPENRLTSYGTAQTDGYSADGLRAWKQTSAGRTYFLYDAGAPIEEFSAAGTLTAINTFGPSGLLERNTSGQTNTSTGNTSTGTVFYTFDERGDVAQRLDQNGNVLSSDLYDGYGGKQTTATMSDPWGFGAQAGYYTDVETGLSLLTHRFYSPSVGRFLTRDPIDYKGGVNLYGYVKNNPVNWLDPVGFMGYAPPGGYPSAPEGPPPGCEGDPYTGTGTVRAGGDIGATIGGAVGGLVGGAAGFAACGPGCAYIGAVFGGMVGGAMGGVMGAGIGVMLGPKPPKGQEACYNYWANEHENDAAEDGLLGGLGGPIVYKLPVPPGL